jgi:hypothetical protein
MRGTGRRAAARGQGGARRRGDREALGGGGVEGGARLNPFGENRLCAVL